MKGKEMKFTKYIYNDGTTVTIEYDEVYDGKWPGGEEDELVIYVDHPYPMSI